MKLNRKLVNEKLARQPNFCFFLKKEKKKTGEARTGAAMMVTVRLGCFTNSLDRITGSERIDDARFRVSGRVLDKHAYEFR